MDFRVEKSVKEKNTVSSYLTTHLVTKSQNTSVNQNSRNIDHKKEHQISNSDKDNVVPVETCTKKSKNLVIIGDSMLNNINGHGLSKSKKAVVLNIPRATSGDIVDKVNDVLELKPESLIVRVGPNDLTNNVNILNNEVNNKVNKVKKTSSDTVLSFSNTICRRDKINLEKTRVDTNFRLK